MIFAARRLVLLIAAVHCAGPALLWAANYGHISGTVLDGSGASVPEASITVVDEEMGYRRTAITGSDGGYLVSSLRPGVYKLTVRKPGFRTIIRFGVIVEEAERARADFKLALGSLRESITVEGAPLNADDDETPLSTVIHRDEIEHLPLNGRGLLSIIELAPGAIATPATRGEAGQFTVNGQRPNTHYFTVDGITANSSLSGGGSPEEITGGAFPGLTAFGSLDAVIPRESAGDVRIQTSSAGANFGRLPGAQISVSSRSGTSAFHGSVAYGFRHEALNANDWFANRYGDARAPLRLNAVDATLGGPIRRDRTFFFLSYEAIRLRQPYTLRQAVPSTAVVDAAPDWAKPALNLFPKPNGPYLANGLAQWTGQIARPSRLDGGAVRVDHTIASRVTIFGRYTDSPSSTEFGNSTINALDLRSESLTAGLNWRARPGLLFDVRANVSSVTAESSWRAADPPLSSPCSLEPLTSHIVSASKSCDYLVRVSIAGSGQVASGREGERSQSQVQEYANAALNAGKHDLRVGFDHRRLSPLRRDATAVLSILADRAGDIAGFSNLWIGNASPRTAEGRLEEYSFFGQDTWRPFSRLTVSYGLRWEISPAPVPDSSAVFLNGDTAVNGTAKQPLWTSNENYIAPRFGVALRPRASGRTVIRAGIGTYFQSSLSLATDLINDGPLNVSNFGSGRNGIFSTVLKYAFLPNLRLPVVKEWNASVEHGLTDRDTVSVAYIGSSGRRLVRREVGGEGSTETNWVALATNDGESDYHAFTAQYHRRMAQGLQARVAYAWSHSIDNSSTDSGLYWAGSGLTPDRDRASSDFDVRHVLTAGFSYDLSPGVRWRALRGWTIDGMLRARSGFPIDVLDAEQYIAVRFENIFRPDLIPTEPVWIADPAAPGGRRINRNAFHTRTGATQGNLGRNVLSGFGMSQLDLSLRREFFSGERHGFELRIESFNALNHPNFADAIRFVASPLFGESNSMLNLMLGTGSPASGLAPAFQTGGARSMQVTVRFRF